MTYQTGSLITHEDYNNFVWGDPTGDNGVIAGNNINYLWGPGYGNRGFNQDMGSLEIPGLPGSTGINTKGKVTPVNAEDTVEAQSWIGFFSALNRMRYYQAGTSGNLTMSPTPAQGRTISTYASVAAKMADAASWFDNPVPLFGVEATDTVGSATRTIGLNYPSYAGTVSRQYSVKISWPTGDHARWFFNSGGKVRIGFNASTTGNPATSRSTALVSAIQGIGECFISAYTNTGFAGDDAGASNTGAGRGYWNLSTSSLQLGSNTLGAGTYSDSYITVWAYRADTAGNGSDNGAVGKSLVIVFTISSGFGSTGALPAWDTDNIDINTGIAIDIINQAGAGAVISKTWSSPTVGSITTLSTVP